MLTYNFLENLRRLELSSFDFLGEPSEADVIVGADELPAQHRAGVADVKLQLTRTPSSNNHSLHLLPAGLRQVRHVVLLRDIPTNRDLLYRESPKLMVKLVNFVALDHPCSTHKYFHGNAITSRAS